MNYQKIHDRIIQRALNENRVYDSTRYHKHHIIPRHENPLSEEIVILTHKEHYVVHYLRSKFCSPIGNRMAYMLLSNKSKNDSSLAGKIGGRITKDNKLGIFSDYWDRSAELKRRYENNIMATPWLSIGDNAKKAGECCYENGNGIYSSDWDRSKAAKENWANQSEEQKNRRIKELTKNSKKGSDKVVREKLGFHALTDEQKKINASLGGKSHLGKKWMNNGIINTRVTKELVEEYINNGWKIGKKGN